ncbi:MAG: hypothetical protein R6U58_05720 [Bacteroidales bacterium]
MNRFLIQYIFPAILFLSALAPGLARQPENPELAPYLINEFDLYNQNWSISQNPDNKFIYVGNSEGLIEYNGIYWRRYLLNDNLPVRSVSVHDNGDIFTGSFEEFGFWRYDNMGELVYHSLTFLTEMERNDEIWKIYILDGVVFFQSFTSIYVYDYTDIEKVVAPYTMLFMHVVDGQFITQILDEGLFWFNDLDFQFIDKSEIFADKKVHAIIPWDNNNWLICTDNSGLYLFDGNDFNYFLSEASGFLENYTCNAAKQINDTTFVFGSILNGIIITDREGSILRNQNTGNGLNNNTVLSLFIDSDAGLWAGLDEGVNYIDLFSPFTHYRSRNGTMGTIYALLEHDDILYIGTNHGLFHADIERKGQTWNFLSITFVPGSHGQVWSLEKFNDHILCGHNEGTFLVRNGRLQKISPVTGGWTMVPFEDLVAGGTYTGIIFLERNDDGGWKFGHKVDNFNEPTRYLETDYLGYLWASHHQKGIYKIELSDDLSEAVRVEFFPSIYGKSFSIKVFKINNRVVFTTPEDIYTFDFVRNEIIPFDGLTEHLGEFKTVTQISHHRKNEYWFIKEDKLALFEVGLDFSAEKKYEIRQENINRLQRNIQLVSLDESNIIIPNPHNFDVYNLSLHETKKDVSRLNIDKILFYGEHDSIVFYEALEEIDVPWKINNMTVHFSDPSLFGQTSKRFGIRIKELDPAWQNAMQGKFTFLDIKHGEYTVEVRSQNGNIAGIPFSVGKPWYYSYTALIVYVIVLALIIWILVKFFRFEISRHKELLAMEMTRSSLEKELDYKSYELMLTMRHLLLKDSILKDLQQQIISLKQESSKYPVHHIKEMEKIINRGLGTQSAEWENAMDTLKLSQQGFFRVLKDKYPQLTPNDLRLCSYLRLNFNTKEIAQLLNISTRGVEISRHRLRKKLKLKKDENLFEFLMSEEFKANT